jgi:hypothetical protein
MTLQDPGFQWGHPLEAIAVEASKRLSLIHNLTLPTTPYV